jgi:hypothetical protein
MSSDTPPETAAYEETESPTREPIDAAVYDERRAEVRVEHNGD